MERISSRKNSKIAHLRRLASDGGYRRDCGEYVCCGVKFLQEALEAGAEIRLVLWAEEEKIDPVPCEEAFLVPRELLDYASPLQNSPGPVFTVGIPDPAGEKQPDGSALVLENVQDPGNVGTVIRTAAAFGLPRVLLLGSCADLYNPKTVRATMGAIFRQNVREISYEELPQLGLPLYGAALSDTAQDIRSFDLGHQRCAVAIGSEGRGLSERILKLCSGQLIIPMVPGNESLNAAVAAAIAAWELCRSTL